MNGQSSPVETERCDKQFLKFTFERQERCNSATLTETQHCPLVQRQRFTLLHFNALLVETLHRVHFSCIDFAAAVHFAKASAAYNPQN
jgi:hypothetical protein